MNTPNITTNSAALSERPTGPGFWLWAWSEINRSPFEFKQIDGALKLVIPNTHGPDYYDIPEGGTWFGPYHTEGMALESSQRMLS